jgi:hypothetical protein
MPAGGGKRVDEVDDRSSGEVAVMTESGPIRSIIILGGGTAGWMSAVYLQRALSSRSGPPCRVTLIESSDIGTIGVGESTTPAFGQTMKFCGLEEEDWMAECNATFKFAIKFAGWSGRPGYDEFWHPFEEPPNVGNISLAHYWLRRHLRGDSSPYFSSCYSCIPMCEEHRAPKISNLQSYDGVIEYAYQIDAGLLATYLKKVGKERGVVHVVDNVLAASLTGDGRVGSLRTERHGELSADLFVDCSGFGGFLINRALGEPFESYSDYLSCDRAVAMPASNAEGEGLQPYTTATALDAGWAWHVPLIHRSGNGYVYSSAHLSPDEAEAELRRRLGDRAKDSEARHLRMRVGRTRRAWVKNCVSIGLAGGFIEPLEATAIYLIDAGLYNLRLNFPTRAFEPELRSHYNRKMQEHYETIRDFIVMHYCTTNREDTSFWAENKYRKNIPDKLRERLEIFREMLPGQDWIDFREFYPETSYLAILFGMGCLPKRSLPILEYQDDAEVEEIFQAVAEQGREAARRLPDHRAFLSRLQGEEYRAVVRHLRSLGATAAG